MATLGDALRGRRGTAIALAMGLIAVYVARRRMRARLAAEGAEQTGTPRQNVGKGGKARTVGVDAVFASQLIQILPIVVPGIASREAALLASLAAVLVARTWLDIWFAAFNGVVVRSIVTRDARLFASTAGIRFALMMWPMSIVNNTLKMNISALALAFRERLARHAHARYLEGMTFYGVAQLDGRVRNADQLLTQDVERLADTLARLYADIAKPAVDVVLFAYKLGSAIGADAPALMLGYFFATAVVLRAISPPFGRHTAHEQALEGALRHGHARVIAHAEEIAFFGGASRERSIVDSALASVAKHARRMQRLRFTNGVVDSVLVKYCATQLAYYILSRPSMRGSEAEGIAPEARSAQPRGHSGKEFTNLSRQHGTEDTTSAARATRLMEDYSRNSGYLINLSQAVGRLVLAGRDLTRLAGYTHRVAEFFAVLEDVGAGRYRRAMAPTGAVRIVDTAVVGGVVEYTPDAIALVDAPVCTPGGEVLVPRLTFRIARGDHTLITGPNGCGKSSLFRVIGGLWPLFAGRLERPPPRSIFYVPQRPYLAPGTLRDQVTYPHTADEARARGFDDAALSELMARVSLLYLVARTDDGAVDMAKTEAPGFGQHEKRAESPAEENVTGVGSVGWDAACDWTDVLSGGEKQRVAMARLFYHRPSFALLDECTSAVSLDVEAAMYAHAKSLGITLVTISHRPSLVHHHTHVLRLDGDGGYVFGRLCAPDGTPLVDPFSFGKPACPMPGPLPDLSENGNDLPASETIEHSNDTSASESSEHGHETRASDPITHMNDTFNAEELALSKGGTIASAGPNDNSERIGKPMDEQSREKGTSTDHTAENYPPARPGAEESLLSTHEEFYDAGGTPGRL